MRLTLPCRRVSVDVDVQAIENRLDPVIGRSREVARVMQILARRRKNNPILLGEPGVGKTAIAEGLALAIVSGKGDDGTELPLFLKGVCGEEASAVSASEAYSKSAKEHGWLAAILQACLVFFHGKRRPQGRIFASRDETLRPTMTLRTVPQASGCCPWTLAC